MKNLERLKRDSSVAKARGAAQNDEEGRFFAGRARGAAQNDGEKRFFAGRGRKRGSE